MCIFMFHVLWIFVLALSNLVVSGADNVVDKPGMIETSVTAMRLVVVQSSIH